MKPNKSTVAGKLRRQAEEQLQSQSPPSPSALPELGSQVRLIHELQVHQIELRMQNKELFATQQIAEGALDRYIDLYDFAPMGYFTLRRDGEITQANLVGACLFGLGRDRLIGRYFGEFLIVGTQPVFKAFLLQVFEDEIRSCCDVEIIRQDQSLRTVTIEATLSANKNECRVVVVDITERKQAEIEVQRVSDLLHDTNAKLNQAMAERRSLEIELLRVDEDQRRMLGCELHDGLGQHLTSLSFLYASLQQQIINLAQPEATNAAQRIGKLINEATAITRSVASGLYPIDLEHGGLTIALEHLANRARFLNKMDCVLSVAPEVQVHNPLIAINLYRIAQEAITNALKHSQAGIMSIDLARIDGKIRLTLTDDGIGIAPSRLGSSMGLGMHSMRYRASLLGGDIQIQSNAPHGTTIIVTHLDLEDQRE